MKWIPKCSKGSNDERITNGPTFIRDQIFVLENLLCRKPWSRACNNGTWTVGAPST